MDQSLRSMRDQFDHDGFLQLRGIVPTDQFAEVLHRCERLFHGEFETGVYPDEWHFRHGISIPDKTKEIVNAWKSDRLIASIVMNENLGRMVAEILGWPSIRIAQDDVILKPPGGSAVGLHQDSTYISQNFRLPDAGSERPLSVTVWIPLETVDSENGTLLYARGSHKWKEGDIKRIGTFHTDATFNHRQAFRNLLINSSIPLQVASMNMNPGDISLHHEDMWHCSDPNLSMRHRRVIAVHFLRGDVEFGTDQPSYIYGRYKLQGEACLREEFFPTTWPRSKFVETHLSKCFSKI